MLELLVKNYDLSDIIHELIIAGLLLYIVMDSHIKIRVSRHRYH